MIRFRVDGLPMIDEGRASAEKGQLPEHQQPLPRYAAPGPETLPSSQCNELLLLIGRPENVADANLPPLQ